MAREIVTLTAYLQDGRTLGPVRQTAKAQLSAEETCVTRGIDLTKSRLKFLSYVVFYQLKLSGLIPADTKYGDFMDELEDFDADKEDSSEPGESDPTQPAPSDEPS